MFPRNMHVCLSLQIRLVKLNYVLVATCAHLHTNNLPLQMKLQNFFAVPPIRHQNTWACKSKHFPPNYKA